jgi:sphinganine C4-monooxygenase
MSFESIPMEVFLDSPSAMAMNASASADVPWYYSSKLSLVEGVPDHYLALAAPFAAYWMLSLFFHYLDTRDWKVLEQYRIHDSAEVASRNRVSRTAVVWTVILQQVIQTALGIFWLSEEHHRVSDHTARVADIARRLALVAGASEHVHPILPRLAYYIYWWAIPLIQFMVAMYVLQKFRYFGLSICQLRHRHLAVLPASMDAR